jgi:hypothetical protein
MAMIKEEKHEVTNARSLMKYRFLAYLTKKKMIKDLKNAVTYGPSTIEI